MFLTPPQLNSNLITMSSYGSELNYEDVATFLPSSHQEENLIKFKSLCLLPTNFAALFSPLMFPGNRKPNDECRPLLFRCRRIKCQNWFHLQFYLTPIFPQKSKRNGQNETPRVAAAHRSSSVDPHRLQIDHPTSHIAANPPGPETRR